MRRGQGSRRDADPLALPAASRHRRSSPTGWASCSGRRSRSTRSRRSTSSAAVRELAARELRHEHPRQPEPPVDHRLVDRQRALGSSPARSRPPTSTRAVAAGPSARPDAARRPRRRRLPGAGCQPAATPPLDVLGINDYFGWYPGPTARSPTATRCSAYLDAVRACYPKQGDLGLASSAPRPTATARSRRRAPTQFQQDFVELPPRRLRHASRGSAGAIYWALQEFRVRPTGTAATRTRTRRSTRRA